MLLMSYVELYNVKKKKMHGSSIQGVLITLVVIELCSVNLMKFFYIW